MSVEQLVAILDHTGTPQPSFRLATVDPDYSGGRPRLVFDGETTVSTRTFPYLSSYTPVAGDRVLVAMVSRGAVVVGKII